ncbi:1-acyl-sn-glycerol-3-phosphate acyltransferase [Caldibacillus thermolactis]|uniref:1-acyl-sn-glycerol-3-phosphate acyltransferase n=1 Tax=Pallidibacillus thermolactis TaxID=251051 RepID=A0ABT2WKY5_9BACI|nr:lysophospholipid acyltransferase family protein [Pallidibacillus thermolactis]MCU9595621.1 1-acyl-sn-glycerol-3-phosphate acyltransferase [Pallidibacillus thermolactis]
MYSFLGNIAKFILKIFNRVEVHNLDKLPKDSGFIIACNHISWVDIVGLGVALLPKQIHFMAKKELFAKKWSKKFITSLNGFPVDRENPGPSSIKIPVKLLKEGKIVGIFPSGTRDGDAPLKRGAVTIANLAKVQIVPAAYVGPTSLKEIFTGKKMRVIIGEPMQISEKGKEALFEATDELSKRINELEVQIKSK